MFLVEGDVYLNTYYGDFWVVVSNHTLVRINTGETLHLEISNTFIRVGHVDSLNNLETTFYQELNRCPLCKSTQVSCVVDYTNMLWKIGCSTKECPCYIGSMVGKYSRREQAVSRWNMV